MREQEPIVIIDKTKTPNHIAVIMDGNGRWAKAKGFIRTIGHEKGAEVIENVVTACSDMGVKYLTLYAFSTENWKRPKLEVNTLMRLLVYNLKKEVARFVEKGVRLNTIGNI